MANPALDRIIACPACQAELTGSPESLGCTACGDIYPVDHGVPVLLTRDSRDRARRDHERLHAETVYPLAPRWRQVRRLVAAPGPFWSPRRKLVADFLRPYLEDPRAVVLHLGAKEDFLGPGVVHIDLYPFSGVDLVTDAEQMGVRSGAVDCVYLPALLEHVPRPARVIAEVHRVLRPGGLVVVEMPFMQGYHADPDDYQRYTLSGLRVLLDSFVEVESGALAGPSSSLALVLRDWLSAWVPRHRFPRGHRAARILFDWSTFWIRYGDAFLISAPAAHELACGLYYIARKETPPQR